MKKTLLLALSCFLLTTIYSQNIVKEHYTVSGGLLGAVDMTSFKLSGSNPTNIEYKTKPGWSAGFWLNFPVGKVFSIEPQGQYNSYRYKTRSTTPLLLNDGEINTVSVPLALKFNLGNAFALAVGPQVDFVTSIEDRNTTAQENDFKQVWLSAFGGFELFPHGRVSIFGRYVLGFSNVDDRTTPIPAGLDYKPQNIQAGLKIKLFGKKVPADSDGDGIPDPKDKCPNVIGLERYNGCPIPDTDGDGINDEEDSCVTQPGTLKYHGCPIPDTDGDGINDEQDKCPTVKGIAKYNGCPIPDTDGDGINDEEDKCPNEAGPASRNGCPVKDRDNDGVDDDVDRCPDVPGTVRNNGCPEVSAEVIKTLTTYAHSITFITGSAKLTTKSNAPLNSVVKLLNDHPDVKVRVEGHTDNVGKDDYNMKLSDARAASVRKYLIGKGINEDRITSQGFGESTPVADNNTAAGRAQNRRVEITVIY
jgi:outer membrane protein OmpA-like peptidoglycan-associated protein